MVRDLGIVLYEGKEISLFGTMKTCEGVVAALGYMKTSREGILCPLWDTKLGLIVSEVQGIERLWLLGST